MGIVARMFILAFLSLFTLTASLASSSFTNAQFIHRGAGAFIGEITSVQIQSSNANSESGVVQLKVLDMVAGAISTPTIAISYTRALQAVDDASNWDNIAPLYASLSTIGVGRSVLIYYTVVDGVYVLASAGNSVQDATSGVLLGTILNDESQPSDRGCRILQIEVVEMIYGSLGGSPKVSLCLITGSLGNEAPVPPRTSLEISPGLVGKAALSNRAELGSLRGIDNLKVLISFNNGAITGIQAATSQFLTQLQQIDSE